MSYLKHKPGSIEELMANEASKLNDNAYQDMFKKELDKAGKGIGSMTPAEKKAFFNKIDDKYKAKNEDIKEEVAIVYTDKKTRQVVSKKFKNDAEARKWIKQFDGAAGQINFKPSSMLKNEDIKEKVSDKQLDTFHKKLDNLVHKTIGKSSDEKKEAVDNPYAVGMAQAMKSTGDKPPLKKSTITKAHDIAKSIEKDEKNEEKDVPKGYHKMPDGTVMKDSEHKKETHSFMTKDMNKSKKDAKGEKEIVDPEPKIKQESLQDAIKSVWQLSAEELEKRKIKAKYMKAQRMNQYKAEKDDKNKTGTADTGSKKTKVDVEPSVDYKN